MGGGGSWKDLVCAEKFPRFSVIQEFFGAKYSIFVPCTGSLLEGWGLSRGNMVFEFAEIESAMLKKTSNNNLFILICLYLRNL